MSSGIWIWITFFDATSRFYAGTFQGWDDVMVPPASPIISHDLSVIRNVHLTSPVDNSKQIEHTFPPSWLEIREFKAYPSSLLFEWEPMPAASYYKVVISKGEGYGTVIEQTVSGTQWQPKLNPIEVGEFYAFCIYAYNREGRKVGDLRLSYPNAAMHCYAFGVTT